MACYADEDPPIVDPLPEPPQFPRPALLRGDPALLEGAEYDPMADDDERFEGRHFHSVKPWVGSMQPPSTWDPKTINAHTPDIKLKMDYVYGYRSMQCRDNVFWVDYPSTILYHAAAVCIVCNVEQKSQRHFTGHEDDILCLTYSPRRRLAASGGLGKRNTAPIFIWCVDTMTQKKCLKGSFEFCVVALSFSDDGKRLFGVGMDAHHSVGIYDVDSGAMLIYRNGDSNRIVNIASNTCVGRNSRRNFVTVGVSHIKFWDKRGEELEGKKASGGDIAMNTITSIAFTSQFCCCGNTAGDIYVLAEGTLIHTMKAAHGDQCSALFATADSLFSGGRDGMIFEWSMVTPKGKKVNEIDLNPASALCRADPEEFAQTFNQKPGTRAKFRNGPKAIHVHEGGIVVGTQLSSIYTMHNQEDIVPVLEGHFDLGGNNKQPNELWGLDHHRTEPFFCTVSEDTTLRLWSLETGLLVKMVRVKYTAKCCCFSPDGRMIAVGHENGAFSVWDAVELVKLLPFTRRRPHRIQAIRFSPDTRYLAMSMGQSNTIDIYYVRKGFAYVGTCIGFSSNVKQIDWNTEGDIIQCCTNAYEVIHFNIPECEVNQSAAIADQEWFTHASFIGWGVQGIWEGCNDGTDINVVGLSHSRKYIVAGYDSSAIRVYNYPCLARGYDFHERVVHPEHREYGGHSSHVTGVVWSHDDNYVITTGGMDSTVIRWKVVAAKQKPVVPDDEGEEELPRVQPQNRKSDIHDISDVLPLPRKKLLDARARAGGSFDPRASTEVRTGFDKRAPTRSRFMNPTASMVEKVKSSRQVRENVLSNNNDAHVKGRFRNI